MLHVRVSVGVVGLPQVVGFFIFILFKNLTNNTLIFFDDARAITGRELSWLFAAGPMHE